MSLTMAKMLIEQRKSLEVQARAITDLATAEKRELTGQEETKHAKLCDDMAALRAKSDQYVQFEADRQAADEALRKAGWNGTEHLDGYADGGIADQFREIVRERSNKRIDVFAESPRSYYQPGIEARALSKSGPANFQPVSFYDRIIEAMVESSAVLKAGATVVTTETGEILRIPRATGFSTAAIVAEGGTIGASDPTLGVVELGAHKYAVMVYVSRELVDDTSVDLSGYIARETGTALGLALGNHLINGTGTGQPRGVLADTTAGVTGPTGTATTLGAQGTAGQGTDLLNSIAGSVLEPYAQAPGAAYLLRTASLTLVRNLKGTTGELVGNQYLASPPAPFFVDPFVPAMAANAKSVLFGDWSRYFVRIVNGVRFERSDDFKFDTDQVAFRAILRADGALIDTFAIKHFANSAT